MKRTNIITGIIFLIGIIFIGAHISRNAGVAPTGDAGLNVQDIKLAERVFALSFDDYEGKIVNLSDYKGKPLVINAWAAWCPFCRKELPDFGAAQEEFGDEVVIIAIDRAESLKTAKQYSDKLGVTGKLVLLLDQSDLFYQTISGFSMPETLFINAAGEIIDHKRGPMDLNEIRERIQKIL